MPLGVKKGESRKIGKPACIGIEMLGQAFGLNQSVTAKDECIFYHIFQFPDVSAISGA